MFTSGSSFLFIFLSKQTRGGKAESNIRNSAVGSKAYIYRRKGAWLDRNYVTWDQGKWPVFMQPTVSVWRVKVPGPLPSHGSYGCSWEVDRSGLISLLSSCSSPNENRATDSLQNSLQRIPVSFLRKKTKTKASHWGVLRGGELKPHLFFLPH